MLNRSVPSVFVAVAACSACLAGPLNPPAGPIAPTNKTLEEVEPRIAVNATNTPGDADSVFMIDQPGSYYLTDNLQGVPAGKHGIEITAADVTLDLNGFRIFGSPGSLDGVRSTGVRTVVRNGEIRVMDGSGINCQLELCVVEDVLAIACDEYGIRLGGAESTVRRSIAKLCNSADPGLVGISVSGFGGIVEHCASVENDGTGIQVGSYGTVRGCLAFDNGNKGISGIVGAVIVECFVADNSGNGIDVTTGGLIRSCLASGNADGIRASDQTVIESCTSYSNSGFGIRARFASVFRSCSARGNSAAGFSIGGVGTVVGCSGQQNGTSGLEITISAAVSDSSFSGNTGRGITTTAVGLSTNTTIVNTNCESNGAEGILLYDSCTLLACRADQNAFEGFELGDGATLSDCSASDNEEEGFLIGKGATLTNCNASANTGEGFSLGDRAVVTACVALENGDNGFEIGRASVMRGCESSVNLTGVLTPTGGSNANCSILESVFSDNTAEGILAGNATLVSGCVATQNSSSGIVVGGGAAVLDCVARQNSEDGIVAGGDSRVERNTCDSNGVAIANGAGVRVTSTDCRVDGNHVTDNDLGIVTAGGSLVIRNSASNNAGGNFSFQATDLVGPTVGGIGVIGSTNPWANFSY